MIKWIQNLDTQDIIALLVMVGFIVATFTKIAPEQIGGLKEKALLTVGYYFGNKSTTATTNSIMDRMKH